MDTLDIAMTRRRALGTLLKGTAALSLFGAVASKAHADTVAAVSPGAGLSALRSTLSTAPRRRNFERVPFLLNDKRFWDHEAADALLAYGGPQKQMWEVTDLAGPWLNLIRESVNSQVFSLGHRQFLAVAAMHGGAHLALFDQAAWSKYKFAGKTEGKFASNTMIVEKPGVTPGDDIQDLEGFYGPNNNNVVTLQKRGVVFVACHDSIHAIARGIQATPEFSAVSADEIAADLTNHLVPEAVLVPSVVGYIAELQRAGYSYAKGS